MGPPCAEKALIVCGRPWPFADNVRGSQLCPWEAHAPFCSPLDALIEEGVELLLLPRHDAVEVGDGGLELRYLAAMESLFSA